MSRRRRSGDDDRGGASGRTWMGRSDALERARGAKRAHDERDDPDAMQLLSSPRCGDAGDGRDQSRQGALQKEKVPAMPRRRRARRRDRARADLRGRPESRTAELRARDRRAHDVQLERAASDARRASVSPNTAMPDFNFKPEESRALTLLLLSWRRLTYPPEYIPDPEVAAAAMQPSPTSTATATPSATPVAH